MPWLSINPESEPIERLDAAQALSQRWSAEDDDGDDWNNYDFAHNLSSTQVAALYNNAEQLGLDLNSIDDIIDEDLTYKEPK
jgi:hypothetical protein